MPDLKKASVFMGLLVLTLLFPPVFSQDTRERAAAPSETDAGPPTYERSGEDLPKYVVVRKFFRVLNRHQQAGGRSYSKMLRKLGIEKESAAERMLLAAAVEAASPEVNARPDLRPYMNADSTHGEGFTRVQHAALRKRVHHLRKVYYGLIGDLEKEGVSWLDVDRVVEEMRAGMVMVSTPTPEFEVLEIMDEFERDGR